MNVKRKRKPKTNPKIGNYNVWITNPVNGFRYRATNKEMEKLGLRNGK